MQDKLLLESFCGDPSEVTYLALEGLFFCSWYNQYQAVKSGILDGMGNKGFLREFCTIKFCTARRSGHSKAIVRLAARYLDRAVFLTPNEHMSQQIRVKVSFALAGTPTRIGNASCIKTNDKTFFFETLHSMPNRLRGHDVEAIIVDGAFAMSQAKIDALYDYPVIKFPFFYIFAE